MLGIQTYMFTGASYSFTVSESGYYVVRNLGTGAALFFYISKNAGVTILRNDATSNYAVSYNDSTLTISINTTVLQPYTTIVRGLTTSRS